MELDPRKLLDAAAPLAEAELFRELRTLAPGFAEGLAVNEKTEEDEKTAVEETPVPAVDGDIFALLDLIGAPDAALDVPVAPSQPEEPTSSGEDEGPALPARAPRTPRPPPPPTFAVLLDTSRRDPDFARKVPRMARKWPFRLDPWQEAGVACLERGESVFVSAHTSAGKTVIAEYAVALSKAHFTRSIYTSPIKALSNQKFREFSIAFGDVGLITGDIQLKPEAACLIMTTEILRSMLYNGSEIIRELEWVIFDEVHYINDSERGVVWEEVLIMLPAHIKIIMLSATAPNSLEFAEWVGRIKKRRINVIGTLRRPVPLQHFLYTGTDGKTKGNRFLLIDEAGKWLPQGYKLAVEARKAKKEASKGKNFNRGPPSDKGVWTALLDHLKTGEMLPVVIFTFSRKRCDENAAMLGNTDLTSAVEKREIHGFFGRCVQRLKGSDRRLPQVLVMSELCKRGLAVHHSGILPILKETVELLFQQGYVKVLFATETFAMGVNMPARTVVFDSMEKHDGKCRRALEPGEYIQMAGRAGRRGLDSTGTVILLTKFRDVPESAELHKMMLGTPTKLSSQFRVTYSMVLNLLRVEELRVEEMLQRSFAESNALRSGDDRRRQLGELKAQIEAAVLPDCPTCLQGGVVELHGASREVVLSRRALWAKLWDAPGVAKAVGPGRLVLVDLPSLGVFGRVAVVLKAALGLQGAAKNLTLLVPRAAEERLAAEDKEPGEPEVPQLLGSLSCPPLSPSPPSAILTLPVAFVSVTGKSLKVPAAAILEDAAKRQQPRYRNASPDRCVVSAVRELIAVGQAWLKDPDEIQLLEDGPIQAALASGFSCRACLSFGEHFEAVAAVEALRAKHRHLAFLLSPANLALLPAYQSKLRVLKRLGYVDAAGMVELKGKVACEVHTAELLITELMVENALSPLSVPELAALLAATAAQFRADRDLELPPRLAEIRERVLGVAGRICAVQLSEGVEDSDAVEELNFGLTHVVHQWAEGVPFAAIMELTTAQEGIIVRCIQRLNEIAIDVRNGARLVGDPSLAAKMEEVSAAIKRDIVFAASLYTTQV